MGKKVKHEFYVLFDCHIIRQSTLRTNNYQNNMATISNMRFRSLTVTRRAEFAYNYRLGHLNV